MKRLVFFFSIAALMFTSCAAPSSKENEAIKEEVSLYDSLAVEAEKASEEIQASMSKLDSLINEL